MVQPHRASPVGWDFFFFLFKFTERRAFVAATPVCLHEELERMCSCQLSVCASRQKRGKSCFTTNYIVMNWICGVTLCDSDELRSSYRSSFAFRRAVNIPSYVLRPVLIMNIKLHQQSFLQTFPLNSERKVLKYLTSLCGSSSRSCESSPRRQISGSSRWRCESLQQEHQAP